MYFARPAIRRCLLVWTLMFCAGGFFCTEPGRAVFSKKNKAPRVRARLTAAPAIGFYTINKNHATNPSAKMSGLASLQAEVRLNERHNAFFLAGIEYFVHGLNFSSYYFRPDSIQLYTGSFGYKYSLYIQEIDIPLQVKYAIKRENNALISPYIMVGYHLRTLLFGDLMVKQNGQTQVAKTEQLTFKNPLITKFNNPFASITIGVQKNNPTHSRNSVFAEISYRVGFSPFLLSDSFTPSSLFINSSHVAFGLGIKF